MPNHQRKWIDSSFLALVGEVAVTFGQLEDLLRCSTAEAICPAIGYPLNAALFARVRFSELVEMYDFTNAYALRTAEDLEVLTGDQRQSIELARQDMRNQLVSVNERRNRVVHSAFLEVEHLDGQSLASVERAVEAFKPFLGRRALDLTEKFCPFENLDEEIGNLLRDIKTAQQDFLAFDHHSLTYRYAVWSSFCTWLQERGHQ